MTLGYIWRTLLCFKEITAGLAEDPDKEMGNFIVCCYLEMDFVNTELAGWKLLFSRLPLESS